MPDAGPDMRRNGSSSPPSLASAGSDQGLDLYLEELGRYSLLSPEEEDRVARKAQAGDQEAIERLVRANLRFVVSVAKRYQNQGLSFADLVQEGNVGLMKAAERFDPDRDVKFISYAVWWIRQSILSALARQSRPVRLPLNRSTEMAKVVRVREELRQSLARDPTVEEIAEQAELDPETVQMLQALNVGELRLDAPVGEEDEGVLMDRFLVQESSVHQELEHDMLRHHVTRALGAIRPRDARVVRLYYGLQGEREHTLEEIGMLLGVTRERVRQLRDRGLREIRTGELGPVLHSFAVA